MLFSAQYPKLAVQGSSCLDVFNDAAEQMLDHEFAHCGQCKEVAAAMKSTEELNNTRPLASINRSLEMR